jgi:intron-binding protein aquarius
MRILGYPAEKISILTTYNGQRSLIMDVLKKRCEDNPLIGMPFIVSTVDKYQGQQNDYVILSLVRTKLIGHLRDIRRLVVAMSRGRLGLYILGRKQLFSRCLELAPVFKILNKRPNRLQLQPSETFETQRKVRLIKRLSNICLGG